MSEETKQVRSLNNVKHDGEWHLPGTTWNCPAKDVQSLIDSGAVEPLNQEPETPLKAVAEMKKKEIIAELNHRGALFQDSEGVEALREVLTMARESTN